LLRVLDNAFNQPLESEEKAAALFAGGILQHGCQCGTIWGATLAAGARAYHVFGPGPQSEMNAVIAAQRLVASYRDITGHVNCFDLTGIDHSTTSMRMVVYFLVKCGAIKCFRTAVEYARLAMTEINTSISRQPLECISHPVSCGAMMAERMGMSGLHTAMAAGFAGGIGLSGGACGALGAAIWIIGLKSLEENDGHLDFENQRATAMIDRFLDVTGFEFECGKITGRKFEDVGDHAAYLRNGGCCGLIEALAESF
jgi:hypothetical protein